jgi:hypothetical protein
MLLFQEPHISMTAATLIGVATIVGGVIANIVTANRNSGKFEGIVNTKLENMNSNIDRHEDHLEVIDKEQENQWRKMASIDKDVAVVKAQLQYKSKGAHNG